MSNVIDMEQLNLMLPYKGVRIDMDLLKDIPRSILVGGHVIITRKQRDGKLLLLIEDSVNYDIVEKLSFMFTDHEDVVEIKRVRDNSLNAIMSKIYVAIEEQQIQQVSPQDLDEEESTRANLGILDVLLAKDHESNIARMVDLLVREGIHTSASDIHVLPCESGIEVRYRVNGVLLLKHKFHKDYSAPLVSRIKVMANMDVSEVRRPLDGRINYVFHDNIIDIRVSTMPIVYGEKVVLRLLGNTVFISEISDIGFDDDVVKYLNQVVAKPEGMILISGPTGSGKTTTLYSLLNMISSSTRNIITIEDPVEKNLDGVSQISVNHDIGLSFDKALKHVLRQDPDVIMLGELRDGETAKIGVQSAMTGHLVLGTIHAQDAPSVCVRLLDMGVPYWLVNSALVCVIAQRLVRIICNNCKSPICSYDVAVELLGLQDIECFYGKGCDFCFGTGYTGRRAIFEVFKVDENITKLFYNSNDIPSARILRDAAVKYQSMTSIKEHGIYLVKKGITTPSEVVRVTTL